MPDAIVYCDCCGKLIMPSLIKEGRALVSDTKAMCQDCLAKLPPDERDELMPAKNAGTDTSQRRDPLKTGMQKPATRGPGGSGSRLAGAERAPSPSSRLLAITVGIASALASAAIALIVMSGDGGGSGQSPRPGGDRPAKSPAGGLTSPQAKPAGPGSAAAEQLAKIKAMRAQNLSTYAEMRGLLVAFPARFSGTPQAEESAVLLVEIDSEYAKRAEDELARAIKVADSETDLDAAVAQINSVGGRFNDGPWYSLKGQAKIAEAVDRLRTRRNGSASTSPNPGQATTKPPGTGINPGAGTPSSAANRGAGVYEPFDPANSASAKGFDGPWQGGMGVAEGSMQWGSLPVKGNRGKSSKAGKPWHTSSYRKIAPHALKDAGLLKNGATLWLSAVLPLGDNRFALGSRPFYYPHDSGFFTNRMNLRDGGQGVGFCSTKGSLQSTVWVGGSRQLGGGAKRGSKGETALVVLKVAWGSDGNPDRVQLFMPNQELQQGKVVSEISADIDQESFDYISFSCGVGTPIDEIRIGASYVDVMGDSPELRAAAEARAEAEAEAAARARVTAIMDEFDRLMAERKYEKAGEYVESKADADDSRHEIMRVAAHIATLVARMPADTERGAKTLVGQSQRLQLVRGSKSAVIKGASEEGLDITESFTINGQTKQRPGKLEWRRIHPSERLKFARLGGLKLTEKEAHVVAAYLAMGEGDFDRAQKAIEKATDHPLQAHVTQAISKRGKP